MTKASELMTVVGPNTLTAENAPIFGFVAAPQIKAVALRLAQQWYGNVTGGYVRLSKNEDPTSAPNTRRDTDPITGEVIFVRPVKKKFDKGNLLFLDAERISEKYISMGLHPLAHAQVWYQQDRHGGPPQLIDLPLWKIINGWAQLRRRHKTEFFQMTPQERDQNGLVEGDIGIIAYGIEDNALYGQMVVNLLDRDHSLDDARRQAAQITGSASGIGIYAKLEHGGFRVKGRSKEWRAKRRANRDMVGQLCGDPTAAELKKYAEGVGISAGAMDMEIIAQTPPNLPPGEQERYLQLERQTTKVQAGERDGLTFEQRVNLMRGPADEDILDVSPEEQPTPKSAGWWDDKTNQRDVREILPVGSIDEFFKFHGANNWADFGPMMADVQEAMNSAADWAASDEIGPAGQTTLFADEAA